MAIIERPRDLAPVSFVSPKQAAGNFHRPVQTKGWKSYRLRHRGIPAEILGALSEIHGDP